MIANTALKLKKLETETFTCFKLVLNKLFKTISPIKETISKLPTSIFLKLF